MKLFQYFRLQKLRDQVHELNEQIADSHLQCIKVLNELEKLKMEINLYKKCHDCQNKNGRFDDVSCIYCETKKQIDKKSI